MNVIRLAALVVLVAIGFLQFDLSEAAAQDPPAEPGRSSASSGFRGPPPGYRDQKDSKKQSSSRSSSTRSRRSSRSSNNAIKTNPLFQFLDVNGDGELSLEEIDAASRMLYSLDANEDDAITADEVEDMVVEGGAAEEDEEDARSSRSSRSSRGSDRSARSSSSRSSNSRASKPRAEPKSGGKFSEMGMAPGRGLRGGMGGGGNTKAADEDFNVSDKNEDGVLTRGEMPRSLRTKFTKMDTNGDKEIDEDEWYDYMDNQ